VRRTRDILDVCIIVVFYNNIIGRVSVVVSRSDSQSGGSITGSAHTCSGLNVMQ